MLAFGVVLAAMLAAVSPTSAAAGGHGSRDWGHRWWWSCEAQLAEASAVPQELASAWATNDARKLASEFTHDGSLVDDRGGLWAGRRAIRTRFETGFAELLKGTTVELTFVNARCISPDVAVAHTTGGVIFPAHTEPLDPAIQTWTLLREAKGWQVASLQTTHFAPDVEPPTADSAAVSGRSLGRSLRHGWSPGRHSCWADLDEIREVPLRIVDAWEANDAAAFASLWTPAGDLVVGGGQYLIGREQIESYMAKEVFGPVPGIRATAEVVEEECVTADVAVLHTAGGILLPGETKVPPERRGTQSWVIVRHGGEWLINAYQNTRVLQEPEADAVS
jgi:uncharacterized protein (TIGR02246 family)